MIQKTQKKKNRRKHRNMNQNSLGRCRRIIAERLSRDRKSQMVKELESLVGMDISGIVDYARQQRVVQKAEELGIPEEDAERILKSEEKMEEAERRMSAYEQQLQAFQGVVLYGRKNQIFITRLLKIRNEQLARAD